MRRTIIWSFLALLAIVGAACSGGNGASGSGPIPGAPGGGSAPARGHHAKFVIKVPPRSHERKHGHYVSPATASLAISVNNGDPTFVNISLGNANCSAAGGGYLQCTISVNAPPGNDTFSFITYDEPGGDGNALSGNTDVPFTVPAGGSAVIPVTLGGIAESVAILAPDSSHVSGTQFTGFSIYGRTALQFTVVPLDADNNLILGPGAPSPSVLIAPAGAMTVVTPGPNGGNTFTLTSTYQATDPTVAQPVTVTAQVTPVPNSTPPISDVVRANTLRPHGMHPHVDVVSAQAKVSLYTPWLYVTNSGNGSITAYDEQGNAQTLGEGAFGELSAPNSIAYDSHTNKLYVVDTNASAPPLDVFTPRGAATGTPGGFPGFEGGELTSIVWDSNTTNLYMTSTSGNTVFQYDDLGNPIAQTEGAFTLQSTSGQTGITYDADDSQLFVSFTESPVAVSGFTEAGAATTPTTGFASVTAPVALAYDSHNGLVYVVNNTTAKVQAFDTSGNLQTLTGTFPGLANPSGIAVDPFNDLIYVTGFNGAVAVYDENGNKQTVTGFAGTNLPASILVVP
jgi:DNA-binding beta-propeller fold protein YncE